MHYFHYKNKELFCEEVPLRAIARRVETPFYVYSYRTLKRHFKAFDSAFAQAPHLTCYSVKANSNLAVLRAFFNLGAGADIVSGGELMRALNAGADPRKIVFSGVGKKKEEIEYALDSDILLFNVESSQELKIINLIARKAGKVARIALRINPDIDPSTHPYITTGLNENKFGIDIKTSLQQYREARKLKNLEIVGVDCHIGSQLTDIAPFIDALRSIKDLIFQLKKEGINISYLDLGGGLGITYSEETPPHPKQYARALLKELKGMKCTLILEPGRVLTGNAGIIVTRVLYTKKSEKKNFVIVDAGMNDLIRPSLYGAFQEIVPVKISRAREIVVDVVGPICETGDFLARDRRLPRFRPGEFLAVMSSGAYGFVMSSNYNSRARAAEVMVSGKDFYVVREHESYEDLIRGESIPEFLNPKRR
ncbi:MAG: diaminopimelate decarboxylase [Deltaproteobacteria bacterium]|nr:MAG: diaminopimelate decarboxylase [Deltaproteobacteria bacterium]